MSIESSIAIDGPAAAGKSAVGERVARELGYRFFDTGAMYRAVTWYALQHGVDVNDAAELARTVKGLRIDVRFGEGETAVFVNGHDATPHLREPAVERNVSIVSRVPAVRESLVRIQRALAAEGNVVMAGRDIGTVVLPQARLKVYLDASAAVRAKRRAEQERGAAADIEELRRSIERRDDIDSRREASPLTAAGDAVIINTDELSLEEVVRRIVKLARD
ncbi:MAG TPA: (d)CMP kinase [Dehalococcoidia bacterium]|nr:(d)CMP kinase [Dehalococcoidia bacterium]